MSVTASPTPMFTTILVRRGACITFEYPNFSMSAGSTFSRKCTAYLSTAVGPVGRPSVTA